MLFESFVIVKLFEKFEKQVFDFCLKKKVFKKDENMEVIINIGLKWFDEEDFKIVCGKCLFIVVFVNVIYVIIFEKVVVKWKVFDR